MRNPAPPKPIPAIGELIAYNGRLAQWRYGSAQEDRPSYVERLAVSDLRLEGEGALEALLGRQVGGHGAGHWSGYCRRPGAWTDTFVNTEGWETVLVETPLPKPRDGKDYTWQWSGSFNGWTKAYYPRCGACSTYHAPDVPLCAKCGGCHRQGRCPA